MPINNILISGAGPTGLSAALFLQQHGFNSRIIEKHAKQAPYSKALGINSRSLHFLESSGVTASLLEQGHKVYALNMWVKNKRVVHLDLAVAKDKYNFMLVLPQAKTEGILTEALISKGIKIDRDAILEHVEIVSDQSAKVNIIHTLGNSDFVKTSCLFAADGAHSTVRNALGIQMIGDTYPEPWYFHDLELDTDLPSDEAHVFMLDEGCIFMLCIDGKVWRVGGNIANMLENLPAGTTAGTSIWSTKFNISHKYSSEFNRGPIYFAGDAAHQHSPIGARGMNLGIEDAYVFAELAAKDNLKGYAHMRQPVAKRVVERVRHMTEIPRGKSFISHVVRKAPFLIEIMAPFFMHDLRIWAMGTDHKLSV